MLTKRELFQMHNLKSARPVNSQQTLTNDMVKSEMRFCHAGLSNEMQHIPPDSELGMDLAQKMSYYQQAYREWWQEKIKNLRAKEAKAKPENPETMDYIHQ